MSCKYIPVGRIIKPKGLKGDLKVISYIKDEDLISLKTFYVAGLSKRKHEKVYTPCEIETARRQSRFIIIRLQGITSRVEADRLRDAEIVLPEEDLPTLKKNEFYTHELYDFDVYTNDGEILGKVKDFLNNGAHDILVVINTKKREILVPVIHDIILQIDRGKKIITIDAIEGLI